MESFGSRKVVVIGVGRVGSHTAMSLMVNQLVDEIVLLDINKDVAYAEAMDLKDWSSALGIQVKVRCGDYSDCTDAQFAIMTAGRPRKAGESRLEMLDGTLQIMKQIVDPLRDSGFNGILISVSNPADVVAEYLYREMGLDRTRIFGTGTALDTFRLRRRIGNLLGLERNQVAAAVMGEHGDSSFVLESHIYFGGIPHDEYIRIRPELAGRLDFAQLTECVHKAGGDIIKGKGATEYGIGGTVARIVGSIIHNDKSVIPLSVHLDGEYGESNVSVGVPCLIGHGGIEHVFDLELRAEEQAKLHNSCEIIRESLSRI